jgi:hypothetical protein
MAASGVGPTPRLTFDATTHPGLLAGRETRLWGSAAGADQPPYTSGFKVAMHGSPRKFSAKSRP